MDGAGGGEERRGGWPWEMDNKYAWSSQSSSSSAPGLDAVIWAANYCSTFPDRTLSETIVAGGDCCRSFTNNGANIGQDQLTCLNLGKRSFDDIVAVAGADDAVVGSTKRHAVVAHSPAALPRCQVEGCGKPLGEAKEYHRRHKVCEAHSKAPKVLVLGLEQRFCQQCSRFHVISEFDDAKRSCRRRLAGHNERRRKNSNDSSMMMMKNTPIERSTALNKLSYLSVNSPGRALSLLSSKTAPWFPSSDLSSCSSAALQELIAENRAAVLARQLFCERSIHGMNPSALAAITAIPNQNEMLSHSVAHFSDRCYPTQVTLDLMQSSCPPSKILPVIVKPKGREDDEIWRSLEGTHMLESRSHNLI